MAATLAVPAQEIMAGLNNASMNNTTLNTSQNLTSLHATSNDTIMNTTTSDPGLNNTSQESALINSTPAANVILPVNDTATIEPAGNASNEVRRSRHLRVPKAWSSRSAAASNPKGPSW